MGKSQILVKEENDILLSAIARATVMGDSASVSKYAKKLKVGNETLCFDILLFMAKNKLVEAMDILLIKHKSPTSKIRLSFTGMLLRLALSDSGKLALEAHFEVEKRHYSQYGYPLPAYAYDKEEFNVNLLLEYETQRMEWFLESGVMQNFWGDSFEKTQVDTVLAFVGKTSSINRYIEAVINIMSPAVFLKHVRRGTPNGKKEWFAENGVEGLLNLNENDGINDGTDEMIIVYKELAKFPRIVAEAFKSGLNEILIYADVEKNRREFPELFVG